VDVEEHVNPVRITKVFDVSRLGLRKAIGAKVRFIARAARRIGRGDTPHDVAVSVNVHAVTRSTGIISPVWPPHIVDGHDVLATVWVGAWQQPDVEHVEHDLELARWPRLAAKRDSLILCVGQYELNHQVDDGVRVHEFARMHAADYQNAAAVCAAAGVESQGMDGAALSRAVRHLDASTQVGEVRSQGAHYHV
jgi:hypothetical protein